MCICICMCVRALMQVFRHVRVSSSQADRVDFVNLCFGLFWHLSLNVQGKPGNAPKGISYITSHDTGFGVLSLVCVRAHVFRRVCLPA
jgi:hypothetical protein